MMNSDSQDSNEAINPQDEFTEMIDILMSDSRLTAWERTFCGSVSQWLAKGPNNLPSYKQKAVLVKMYEKYQE